MTDYETARIEAAAKAIGETIKAIGKTIFDGRDIKENPDLTLARNALAAADAVENSMKKPSETKFEPSYYDDGSPSRDWYIEEPSEPTTPQPDLISPKEWIDTILKFTGVVYNQFELEKFSELLEQQFEAIRQSEREKAKWNPISSAPKGHVREEAGCRGVSEWFIGLSKDGNEVKIKRLPKPEYSHEWADEEETYYEDWYFTHWKALTNYDSGSE